jgi:hypothetical protein
MDKVRISEFLAFFKDHAVKTSGEVSSSPESQFGYVWGAAGQLATDAYLKSAARTQTGYSEGDYVKVASRWLGRRVFDCNGLAEGFYKDKTGKSINTTAKSNYSGWCDPKQKDKSSALPGMPQQPGIALFSGNSSVTIGHVGFLLEKYGPGPLDWYVLECKGVKYGLVITELKQGKWAWWGKMTRFFEYDLPEAGSGPLPPINIPSFDSDQKPVPVPDAISDATAQYIVAGQSVNVRSSPNSDRSDNIIAIAHQGDVLTAAPATNGWMKVEGALKNKKNVSGYMVARYLRKVVD